MSQNSEPPNEEEATRTSSGGYTQQEKRENDPTRINIHANPADLVVGISGFFKSLLSLRNEAYDVPGVMLTVREGIVFKGYNVWILMFSIIIASVGLNVDSTAVIIGAMLISPLMGPIRGIGFGVGMHDFGLLLESVKNFGITVAISLFTSWLYFWITPVDTVTSNIFARTEPTFLDVVIAFFGGLAGVIALSKKMADTVIPGVAIATALMPPLCTAGYGLANGEWAYFLGASYLFLLNSVLIAASTYVFIRYLKFPKKEYLTPHIEKRVKAYTLIFIIVAVAPSIYMFYRMTKKSIFESNAAAFVQDVVMNTDDNIDVNSTFVFDWDDSKIKLSISNYFATEPTIKAWKKQLETYDLEKYDLEIKQGMDFDTKMKEWFNDYDASNQGANTLAQLLSQRENQLMTLQEQIDYLKENPLEKPDPLQMDDLLAGFKIDYPEYKGIYINRSFTLNAKSELDTVYMLSVIFKESIAANQKPVSNAKISNRLKLELERKLNVKQDSVRVIEF